MDLQPVKSPNTSESEGGINEDGPNNPMLIDLIIDKVFKSCDFKTLGNCRRVSKLWFDVSLPRWLEKAPQLKLSLNDGYRYEWSNMSSFLRLAHNDFKRYTFYEYAGLRQYKKFQVKGSTEDDAGHQLLQLFLRTCGQWITQLSLSLECSADVHIFEALLLSRMTPNLIKLDACLTPRINIFGDIEITKHELFYEIVDEDHNSLTSLQIKFSNYYSYGSERDDFPIARWIQLLQRYPQLKNLVYGVPNDFSMSSSGAVQGVIRMVEAIREIREVDKKRLDLKQLELYCSTTDDDLVSSSLLALVRDGKLALETLAISVDEQTPNETVYQVLSSQAATLRKLILHKRLPLRNFEPPQMDTVQILELHGYPFQDLAFLKSFLHLKSLSFVLDDTSVGHPHPHSVLTATKQEDLEGLVLSGLTKLHWNYSEVELCVISPGDIRKLHGCMPNLTDLQLWLSNESFRVVCEVWPHLKHLSIVGSTVDDEGITGVVAGEKDVQPNNIRVFQQLESLSMKNIDENYEDDAGPAKITRSSVSEFLQLPKLKKLELTVHPGYVDEYEMADIECKTEGVRFIFARDRADLEAYETYDDFGGLMPFQ